MDFVVVLSEEREGAGAEDFGVVGVGKEREGYFAHASQRRDLAVALRCGAISRRGVGGI